MILHIAKKEIYHHLMTLRFALMIILLPILMLTNALIYGLGDDGYTARIHEYNRQVAESLSHIENAAESLGELAVAGPGEIPKKPSPLEFCADGTSEMIPRRVTMRSFGMQSRSGAFDIEGYRWRNVWTLEYPSDSYTYLAIIKIDWSFVGTVMSFLAILLTFDAIAGERERGTLSLMMANQISRGQVLFAKYLGAFVSLMVPLIIGILMNLLVINFIGSIPFEVGEWLRILGMVGLFALLVSIFIFLGLFFSCRVSNAITSLVWLLLTWVCLAFVFPSMLSIFVANLSLIPSIKEISLQKQARLASIEDNFRPLAFDESNRLKQAPSIEEPEVTRDWARYFIAISETKTRINDKYLDQQLRQVLVARDFAQISPITCFQYAMEGLANTGVISYLNFIKQVRRYRQTFTDFIRTEDRRDLESLHIYPVKEGLSQKPVNPKAVPRFEERISYRNVLFQVGLLLLFNLLFFIAADLSFLKSDIK